MYGYASDEVKAGGSGLNFGLNAGTIRLVKFEWIPNAGKDGAEGEALDIQFNGDNADRNIGYRLFPVTKVFGPNNTEITDPKAPEFQKKVTDLNSCIVHILHCFVGDETIRAAFLQPIESFKEFCKVAMSLLPQGYETLPLDGFAHYQWQISGDNTKTYLEFPKNMKQGKWLCAEVPPVGEWKEVRVNEPTATTKNALKYTDEAGNIHPFTRSGWFMLSNFATQQVDETKSVEIPSIPGLSSIGDLGTPVPDDLSAMTEGGQTKIW